MHSLSAYIRPINVQKSISVYDIKNLNAQQTFCYTICRLWMPHTVCRKQAHPAVHQCISSPPTWFFVKPIVGWTRETLFGVVNSTQQLKKIWSTTASPMHMRRCDLCATITPKIVPIPVVEGWVPRSDIAMTQSRGLPCLVALKHFHKK